MDGYESPSERFRNHNIREGLRYRIFVVKRQYHPFAFRTLIHRRRRCRSIGEIGKIGRSLDWSIRGMRLGKDPVPRGSQDSYSTDVSDV